jgi:6-phosphogluconolactonase (cycloisomerase 2 family)
MRFRSSVLAVIASMSLFACTASTDDGTSPPAPAPQPSPPSETPAPAPVATNPPANPPPASPPKDLGAVFTIDNDAEVNHVLAFARAEDGTLSAPTSYDTFGRGTGAGLGSQAALALSADAKTLVVVDAGSNEISSFAVDGAKLTLVSNVYAGGMMPTSVAIQGSLVYVLNAGDSTVSGFSLDAKGNLAPIANSTRSLSGPSVGGGQIAFSPSGDVLVVSEKGTNMIDTFVVAADGTVSKGEANPSNGQTPFGFAFSKAGVLVVSEAFGGAAGAAAVSTYTVGLAHDAIASGDMERDLVSVSASVKDNQGAACWIAITADGKVAYTTNAASGNVSAYAIGSGGALSLVGDGVAASTGSGSKPLDMAIDRGSKRLYVLDGGNHAIQWFAIGTDGALTKGSSIAVPATAFGVVGY